MGAKAKESAQVEKARRKLKQKIGKEHKRLTKEGVEQMARLIEQQLVRHSRERIDLKKKTITLFDENRHSAEVKSKFVTHLLSNLKEEGKPPNSLEGRIQATS